MALDRLPVAQAQSVVGLSKSRFYEAMKELSIRPIRVGRASFLTMDDIERLSNFRQWIRQYGSPNGFPGLVVEGSQSNGNGYVENGNGNGHGHGELVSESGLIDQPDLSLSGSELLSIPGFKALFVLEYAYQRRWWLTTSQLSEILGFARTWFRSETFVIHGFALTRRMKLGTQYQWQIGKVCPD
ncbi:hypothetical protein [Synechococcus sp. PCC 6312]|uniref:hypothetical protein n=1 Tax=Synechococcus sp. (strain ATCC 27167 / PCC 6312) TaxID=195253 RepID=UPI00029EC98A|nr:hypothetical protein [Synechococcus sp. PCC 6312]AFY61885.1 hypothetical protein Syn6312_2808 [Synechococcus sp. PCC 6312]